MILRVYRFMCRIMTTAKQFPGMSDTTISLPEEIADELYERKSRGESYADVIRELLEQDGEAESVPERRETSTAGKADASDRGDTTAGAAGTEAAEAQGDNDLIDAVAEDVLPGTGAKLEERREALRATVRYLRNHGEATPNDFRTDVYPEHKAQYTNGNNPSRSWWKNCIYKGLAELADRSVAVEKADTSGTWSWVEGSDLEIDQ